jgi:hypothetical protein
LTLPPSGRKRPSKKGDAYFGLCPTCHKNDGCTNVGRSHWFYCKEHKKKWCAGANLFSDWRDQSEDEQRQQYDAIGLGEFEEVEPYFPATVKMSGCSFGCRGATMTRIYEALDMTEDQMARAGLDLDLFDCARRLITRNIDLDDRRAVEEASNPLHPDFPPHWLDAVLIAARDLQIINAAKHLNNPNDDLPF